MSCPTLTLLSVVVLNLPKHIVIAGAGDEVDGAALSVRPRRLPKYVSDLAERSYECETERKNATAMFQAGNSIDIFETSQFPKSCLEF